MVHFLKQGFVCRGVSAEIVREDEQRCVIVVIVQFFNDIDYSDGISVSSGFEAGYEEGDKNYQGRGCSKCNNVSFCDLPLEDNFKFPDRSSPVYSLYQIKDIMVDGQYDGDCEKRCYDCADYLVFYIECVKKQPVASRP